MAVEEEEEEEDEEDEEEEEDDEEEEEERKRLLSTERNNEHSHFVVSESDDSTAVHTNGPSATTQLRCSLHLTRKVASILPLQNMLTFERPHWSCTVRGTPF